MIKKKRIKKKKKNPYLKKNGSLDLIDEFVGIDFMPYERKRKRKKEGDQ